MNSAALRAVMIAAVITALPFTVTHAASPATASRYQELGYWNHVDVVYRYGTDETITCGSDDTWARTVREDFVGSGQFGLRCLYPNLSGDPALDCNNDPSQGPVSRPGWIVCAFIQRYNGYWEELTDYANIGVGQSLIAIRDDDSTPATGEDCSAIYAWMINQNSMNGFPPPVANANGGGGGGGGITGGPVLPVQHRAQHPRKAPSKRHCTSQRTCH